ncbi:cyclic peptide export ABC transporter [Desulfonema magnum]|uniref:Cyclic peptide ABC transporter, ATP-binding protein n=1 Tax=Desulfonema magnum TaxID=45655 RepID=A0A975BLB8_9BACT|nr:cyclic peptide export ABC transporter [Desulfonema magnum]QTA87814.1 Cyclic peptide ABC transporter, ATP-binding protein [Desulfonema magnum]
MEFIRFLIKESPEKATFILMMSLFQGVAAGVFPIVVIHAAADITAGQGYILWLFLLIGCILIQIGTYYISESQTAMLTEQALEEMVLGIADFLRREELPEFERRNHAEIRLSMGEARAVAEAAVQSVRTLQSFITLFVVWLYIFFGLSRVAGMLFLLVFTLILMINEVFQKISRDQFVKIFQAEKRLFDIIRHFLDGFREIRISHAKSDDLFDNHLRPIICNIQELRHRLAYVQTDFMICLLISISLLTGTDVFFLSSLSQPGVIIQLLVFTLYAFKPSMVALAAIPLITRGQAALERLKRFGDKERHTRQSESCVCDPWKQEPAAFHTLTLEDIVFTYREPDGTPGFSAGPFSLTLRAGEIMFLAGGNGSGKSTFVKMLTGLYPPASGKVMIDGNRASLSDHRDIFSAVFTDFHLFDALYGIENPDEGHIRELLERMRLTSKTGYSDGRFTTTDLSAGQRRRLALVVALQEEKPVYAFDEWAADQDPDFRRWFYEELLPSLKDQGKAVVVVSHDDRYYHLADRLITMKDGKIADDRIPGREPEREISDPVRQVRPPRPAYGGERAKSDPSASSDSDYEDDQQGQDPDIPALAVRRIRPVIGKLGGLALIDGLNSFFKIHILFEVAGLSPGDVRARWIFLFALVMLSDVIVPRRFNLTVRETLEAMNADFRTAIINRIRKIGLIFFEALGAGPIFTVLTEDITSLSNASLQLAMMLKLSAMMLSLVVYFAFLAFPLFMIEVLVIGGIGLLYVLNQYRIADVTEGLRQKEAAFYDAVTHLIEGFKELRLNDRKNDAFFHQSFKRLCSDLRSQRLRSAQYMMANTVIVYTMWTVLLGMLPLLFPFVSISKDVLFRCIGILCFIPINIFVNLLPPILTALASFGNLRKTERNLRRAEPDVVPQVSMSARETFRELRCQDIVFRYKDQKGHPHFSVGPLNLSLRAGQIIFVVGGNGSGKSTLVKLITGLYPPESGQILLNGQVTDIRRHRYLFSVIFSDFHLFDRLYGIPAPDEEKVNRLVRLMGMEEKVKFADGKFTTTNLSTGQRKRLAMVAAIMEDRPIFLFDEWAAEQDPQFRGYFYETLLPEFRDQGKTVITVTHHDQYFHLGDRVLKMEYGKLISDE